MIMQATPNAMFRAEKTRNNVTNILRINYLFDIIVAKTH